METSYNDTNKSILHTRARKLAQQSAVIADTQEQWIQMVSFYIGGEAYCIEAPYVREVLTVKEITIIPGTPAFVEGVINVRGQIVSIINLCKFFNMKMNDIVASQKVIVLSASHLGIEFGLLVDQITGTLNLSALEISSVPQNLTGAGSNYLKGISTKGVIVIDAIPFLTSPELVVNQSPEAQKQIKK